MVNSSVRIIDFGNTTREDKKLLKKFVDFHWKHYKDNPQYIPLLDYEYLGWKLIGMRGFFEPSSLFFKHAKMRFFLAEQDGEIVGHCNAFTNENHNKHWHDKIGFFGQFESIDNQKVAKALINAAISWLKAEGMDTIRGPQNLPANEATPGLMTEGFDSRPVVYYQYSKPYYEKLLRNEGFEPAKRFMSLEGDINGQFDPKFERVAKKVIKRYGLKIETWDERPLKIRKKEMFEIYNDAWNDNWGFVPFTEEEFFAIVDDMMLVMDKGLFLFVYINDEAVAFFGGVPNIFDKMRPGKICRRCELIRAARMLLTKRSTKGYRLGYLGIKKKYRKMGLDGVMLYKQKLYSMEAGYEYADMGWVLEDNVLVFRLMNMVGGVVSKVYTIFDKKIID